MSLPARYSRRLWQELTLVTSRRLRRGWARRPVADNQGQSAEGRSHRHDRSKAADEDAGGAALCLRVPAINWTRRRESCIPASEYGTLSADTEAEGRAAVLVCARFCALFWHTLKMMRLSAILTTKTA